MDLTLNRSPNSLFKVELISILQAGKWDWLTGTKLFPLRWRDGRFGWQTLILRCAIRAEDLIHSKHGYQRKGVRIQRKTDISGRDKRAALSELV